MNFKSLFMLAASAAMLTACSNDEPNVNTVPVDEQGNSYLTVLLAASDGSRADFVEGTSTENQVNDLRFYFFDKDGNAANVKGGKNFFNATPEKAGTNMPNVSAVLKAVVVINTEAGDQIPEYIYAVANYTQLGLGDESKSLAELRALAADYTGLDGKFPMVNSVYVEGGKTVYTTLIPKSSFKDNTTDAENAAVEVYIERPVAKVSLTVLGGTDTKIALNEAGTTTPLKVDGEQLYLQIKGWKTVGVTPDSRLQKEVNAGWNVFTGWNDAVNHRSFWAQNTKAFAFSDIKYFSHAATTNALGTYEFVNENAANAADGAVRSAEYPTQVLIAGQVVKADNSPVTLYRFLSKEPFAGLNNLKTFALSMFQQEGYKIVNGSTESDLTLADIKLVKATELGLANLAEDASGRYKSYFQLVNAAATYKHNGAACSATDVNNALVALGAVQLYNDGLNYYYFPIEHFGGLKGVVRNHVYQCNVTAISGLGTPVYDPNEDIIPEKPESDNTIIAARVNVLSWRVVPNNVTIAW